MMMHLSFVGFADLINFLYNIMGVVAVLIKSMYVRVISYSIDLK